MEKNRERLKEMDTETEIHREQGEAGENNKEAQRCRERYRETLTEKDTERNPTHTLAHSHSRTLAR